jgi:hypothetical protein
MSVPDGWHSTVRRLKKELPPPLPVSIRTKKDIPGRLGHCWKRGGRFYIEIAQGCQDCMYHTLAHEYAHLFDWHDGIKEHSESFGCWFARAYQVVYETE